MDKGHKWRAEIRQAALGLKGSQVAEAAGMTSGGYRQLLDGDNPTLKSLQRVEDVLGVERGWLVKTATPEQLAAEAATFPIPQWVRDSAAA